ncbi:MAG TPA: glucose-1-phosphate adenylyltransferase family protein [Acidimicrobiales bacterium]|nr:glucose-1-phosphate adenylyltransferase family protein [Acidimicrobiales bacterium]
MVRVLAIVMAGGAGSRLAPLTDRRAKPAVPYAGVYRLIDFPLSNCAHSGIDDVWVAQQYQPHALAEHLAGGRPWDLDRTRGGLQVLFPHLGDAESGWHQGNADAIHRNRSLVRKFDPDVVLVLSSDHIYTLDYRTVVEAHCDRGAELTMVTTVQPEHEVGRFGNVDVDDDGRVRQFRYKPDEPLSDVVTTEVFAFDAGVVLDAVEELGGSGDDGGLEDLGDDLLPYFVDRGRTWAHPLDGYWRDVGTVASYWSSHLDLLGADPVFSLDDPRWPILTAATPRAPARLWGSASVDDALVAPGCVVAGDVWRSVLGPGVVVEEGATVRSSVLLEDTVVRAGATVSGAICDMASRIGRGASVGQLTDPEADDVVVVGEGVEVADGTVVAPGARLPPSS